MFKAVLLDFNGVVVDDEPYQEKLYIEVLRDMGLNLSGEQYREHFLGKDDYSIARQALKMAGQEPDEATAKKVVGQKTRRYLDTIAGCLKPVRGVADFMHGVKANSHLGIVSGAPRAEIEHVLGLMDLEGMLDVFVPLEGFERGKPDPQGYLLGLALLNLRLAEQSTPPILPHEVLVVEDSRAGFAAGKAAGMAVAAITSSHPAGEFPGAWAATPHLLALGEKLLPLYGSA